MSIHKKLIIIGAGIAGLAAANQLRHSHDEIIILEARNRIGGRIWTEHRWHTTLSLGAAWIHGSQNNPIFDLANHFKAPYEITDFANSLCYDTQRKIINPEPLNFFYSEFEKLITKAIAQTQEKDAPLSAVLTELLKREPEIKKHPELLMRSLEALCLYMGGTPEQLSTRYLREEEILPGGNYYLLKGYAPIIDELAKDLEIHLNTVVQKVIWHGKQIEIVTNQKTYQADKVLITVPLGVLQQGLIQFEPALPAAKQSAIAHLAMGNYEKVFLRFPHIFWPMEYHTISLSRYRDQYISFFFNDAAFCRQPIISGIVNPAKLKQMEAAGDSAVIADTMTTLKYYFGDQIPDASDYLITHWWQNPFSYGAYSFIPYGGSSNDYDLLAAPISNRLFFAGEATHRKHLATVHGAYLSGIREAQRISNDVQNNSL